MEGRVRLGISSCLLGNAVRWNSGHKLDRYLALTLGQFVDYVSVCPEVEAGFGIPRESMRLVGDPESPRLVTFKTKTDKTEQMLRWARKRVKELEKEDLHALYFQKRLSEQRYDSRKGIHGKGDAGQTRGGYVCAGIYVTFSADSRRRRWPAA